MKNFEFKTLQEIASDAIDKLKDGIGSDSYGCDLHNKLFNQDYYIIGRYDAEKWLESNTGVFNAIGIIQDYEESNLGEVLTDLTDPEKIVNMLVYIAGEEILNESETLQKYWDKYLDSERIEEIINELKETYDL